MKQPRITGRLLPCLLLLAVLLCTASCNKGGQQAATDSADSPAQELAQTTPPVRETTGGNVPPAQVPAAAPDFSYTAFDGTSSKLSALTGKPTVVNLWAVW